MFDKIVKKIFIKKSVFWVYIALIPLFAVVLIARGYYVYDISRKLGFSRNPYDFAPNATYSSFMEFVDKHVADFVINGWSYWNDSPLYSHYMLAFINQADDKGIISLSEAYKRETDIFTVIEKVYLCDAQKMQDFKSAFYQKYKKEFPSQADDDTTVDCKKVMTVPLAPESYYFLRHIMPIGLIISFVFFPVALLLFWLGVRFFIISPILWLTKQD